MPEQHTTAEGVVIRRGWMPIPARTRRALGLLLTLALLATISAGMLLLVVGPGAGPATPSLMLAQPVDQLPAVADFAWNHAAAANDVLAFLLWLALVELLGVLAFPLLLACCRHFPDRGWGLAKLTGWLLVAYPLWLGASLRLVQFTLPTVASAFLVGVTLSALLVARRRDRLRATLRGAGRAVLFSEAMFLIAGAFFLFLRLKNPDLWSATSGSEKPMDLAHMNAVLRSAYFPPYDPWFADGTTNYYYFGQYLVAVLTKLTGIPSEMAFNLAMPTLSALVAGAAFSVAAALASRGSQRSTSHMVPLVFGALGAFAVLGTGNLTGLGAAFRYVIGRASEPPGFDYLWGGARAIGGAITEFPFFTQIWADLHAHAVALPFTMLALGLAIAASDLLRGARRDPSTRRGEVWGVLSVVFGLLALTIGALAVTNTWDVPTYLLIAGIVVFHGALPATGHVGVRGVVTRIAVVILGILLVGGLAYLIYLPFFRAFVAPVGTLARTRFPSTLTEYLRQFGPSLVPALVLLAVELPRRFCRGGRRERGTVIAGAAVALLVVPLGFASPTATAWLASRTSVLAGTPPTVPAPHSPTAAFLLLLLALLGTVWILAANEPALRLPISLLLCAVGVTLVPDLVFVADDSLGTYWERMNTAGRLYLQGWTLYALGGAGAVAWLWDTVLRPSSTIRRAMFRPAPRYFAILSLRGGALGCLVLPLLVASVYPIVATPIRLAERFAPPAHLGLSLDGNRWMAYGTILNERCEPVGFADDLAAIRWLNATIVGTPVVAEASVGEYRGNGSRISVATGLPTILGWEHHEAQQRPGDGAIAARWADIRTLYNGNDEARKISILGQYHVSYVVVGAVERHWYYPPPPGTPYPPPPDPPCGRQAEAYAAASGLMTLEGLAGRYLEPVFRSGETVIYRVLPTVAHIP